MIQVGRKSPIYLWEAGLSSVPDAALLLPAAEQGPKYSHSFATQ
jgi:hypothetical protein